MPKFEQDDQILLDGCSTTLEFFLVKHIYIFVLVNSYYIYYSDKECTKNFQMGKKKINNFFLVAQNMVFGQNIITNFFLQIISLHKLHFHVCYEEVY